MGIDFSVYIVFDWIRVVFIIIVYFIRGIVIFYSKYYIESDKGKDKFLFLVILFVMSINLLIISPRMGIILLGWDGLGLVSYCLVIFYINERSRSAGIITVITNRLGDTGLIISLIVIIRFRVYHFSEIVILRRVKMIIIGLLILLGVFTKRAQIPFSVWLPAAIAAPTPVSALVHSSTLVTAGVFLVIRLSGLFRGGILRDVIIIFSVITIFIAGVGAIFEIDLKKIIALSTLRQLGLIIIILSLGKYEIAFFHLITHALFKAILFLCAGVIIHGLGGWQDIRILAGIFKVRPFLTIIIVLGRMSLFGFPFLSGFYSKDIILEIIYIINNRILLILIIMIRTVFRVIYSMRLLYYLCWNRNFMMYVNFEERGINLPIYFMGNLVVFFGSFINWVYFSYLEYVFLWERIKVINLFLVLLGLIYFVIQYNLIKRRRELNNVVLYLRELWFLKNLTREIFLRGYKFRKYYSNYVDLWVERVNSQGVYEDVEKLILNLLKINFFGLTIFIWIFFIILILL